MGVSSTEDGEPTQRSLLLQQLHLAGQDPHSLWDVLIDRGTVQSIEYRGCAEKGAAHSLLLPSLCHPHIHLDKAFLFSAHDERYQDLLPTSGTFKEALHNTATAKARYDVDDLGLRGSQLIAESFRAGVTAMRAFVEVDHTVSQTCIQVAVSLKQEFRDLCHVQIVAFAQDPIFSGPYADENKRLLKEAATEAHVDVIGTTPYVEKDREAAVKNIVWAVDVALERKCHLDFHLDYNLDESMEPLVWTVVHTLRERQWSTKTDKTVVLGHCTRLTLFSDEEMFRLASEIEAARLPISFIGLPTSDLYMMGRSYSGWGGQRPRGTLQIPSMIGHFGLNAAIGVNNVGNSFTPWGSCDPLSLACIGTGVYQTGGKDDVSLLYECVSTRARKAIGLPSAASAAVKQDDPAHLMLYHNAESLDCGPGKVTVPARIRRMIQDIVWDPPSCDYRQAIGISGMETSFQHVSIGKTNISRS